MSPLTLSPGVLIEPTGDTVLVITPGASETLHLNGEAATLVTALTQGLRAPRVADDTIAELTRRGILSPAPRPGLSRRTMIKASAAGTGAGILALTLPTAAMASSGPITTLTYQGLWFDDSDGNTNQILFGIEMQPSDVPTGVGDPGPLSIGGLTVPFEILDGTVPLWVVGEDNGSDQLEPFWSEATGGKSSYEGTFTWGGTTYRATFDYGQPGGS